MSIWDVMTCSNTFSNEKYRFYFRLDFGVARYLTRNVICWAWCDEKLLVQHANSMTVFILANKINLFFFFFSFHCWLSLHSKYFGWMIEVVRPFCFSVFFGEHKNHWLYSLVCSFQVFLFAFCFYFLNSKSLFCQLSVLPFSIYSFAHVKWEADEEMERMKTKIENLKWFWLKECETSEKCARYSCNRRFVW